MADANVLATFRALVPEFASVSDSEVEEWLDLVATRCNVTFFGSGWTEAVVWRAAHLMKSVGPGASAAETGASGPVSSRRAGPRAITFANLANSQDSAEEREWMSTTYGRKYLQLRRSRADNSPEVILL